MKPFSTRITDLTSYDRYKIDYAEVVEHDDGWGRNTRREGRSSNVPRVTISSIMLEFFFLEWMASEYDNVWAILSFPVQTSRGFQIHPHRSSSTTTTAATLTHTSCSRTTVPSLCLTFTSQSKNLYVSSAVSKLPNQYHPPPPRQHARSASINRH